MERAMDSFDLATTLNRNCRCVTLDREALRQALDSDDLLRERPHMFSDSALFVSPAEVARMRLVIDAVEQLVGLPAYREVVLDRAPAIARFDPGPTGVFLGYDFHLTAAGPKLIEINTNAGGAMLGAVLRHAQIRCCPELRAWLDAAPSLEATEQSFVGMFLAEWRRQRMDTPLRTLAIVDDRPGEQYLRPEMLLFARMFRRHGIEAFVVDAAELGVCDGKLHHDGRPVDLVYNRLTDFYLEDPRHEALRAAYLDGRVVLTPHPRAHALYADKRNLALLSDPSVLEALPLAAPARAILLDGVPRTEIVTRERADDLWRRRKRLFFKPSAGYGSKAAYRGDKLTKTAWRTVLSGSYVAQETVPPSERSLTTDGTDVTFKADVRNYVYDRAVQLLLARLYRGQATNLRTPGGGFAPVFSPEGFPSGVRRDEPRACPGELVPT